MIILKLFRIIRNSKSMNIKYSSNLSKSNLIHRDLINPDHLSSSDLKALIWTAEAMRTLQLPSKLLNGVHVTLLSTKSNPRFQISFERAAQNLGAKFSSLNVSDFVNDDYGRVLSAMTDVIVTHGIAQYEVECLAEGSKVPVINAASDIYNQLKAFADLFTLLNTIGPLKRRCLAWVGPPTALCNTLIYLAPKLKLNLRLFCICPQGNGKMSAVKLDHGLSRCRGQSEIHQCTSSEDAVYRADIIVAAEHNVSQHCLTSKVLEEAALEWYLLHGLPRSGCEVSSDVFRHKNNLTWLSAENTKLIAMALLLRVLKPYQPTCAEPDFDGPP